MIARSKIALSGLVVLVGAALLMSKAQVVNAVVSAQPAPEETKDVAVKVNVKDGISLTVNKNEVDLGDLIPGSTQKKGTNTVTATVATNTAAGWELSVSDSDATVTLANGVNYFTAFSGTFAGGGANISTATTDDVWGYRLDTWTADYYAGLPAKTAPQKINEATGVTSGAATTIGLVAATKPGSVLPAGVYTGAITFTAVTK